MKRRTSVETSQTPSPHPRLAAALSCMDVQLEAELARYRRVRRESEDSPAASRQPSSPYLVSRRTTTLESLLSGTTEPRELASPLDPSTETPPIQPLLPTEAERPLPPPLEAQPDPAIASAPDDYLESSEQLLRGLEPEPIVPPAPAPIPVSVSRGPNLADRLLTPLGVVSLLLLLVSGSLLAAALIDPALLTKITGQRDKPVAPTPVAANPSPAVPSTPAQNPSPKLQTDEFVQLDLNNLSTVEASPKPAVPPAPAPSAAPVPPLPPSAVPPDNSSTLTRALIPPINPSPAASPSPEAAKPETAPAPSPGDRYYYVTSNYSDVASLQQAKTIVPDAYLREFEGGTRIQMGAFLRQSEAENLAEQLRSQGYSASVYRR